MNISKIPPQIPVFGDNLTISNWMMENLKSEDTYILRRKPVFGVGINDAEYNVTTGSGGKRKVCPAYRSWYDMMARGYCEVLKRKHPTYKGVSVCDNWHSFTNFRSWWCENQVDGWHLDKDLIKLNNKIYSEETCVFVPQNLNKLITDHGMARGCHKIGVRFDDKCKKYIARCWSQITGKREYLGCFNTEDEAYNAWLENKMLSVEFLKDEMNSINPMIYPNVCRIIKDLK